MFIRDCTCIIISILDKFLRFDQVRTLVSHILIGEEEGGGWGSLTQCDKNEQLFFFFLQLFKFIFKVQADLIKTSSSLAFVTSLSPFLLRLSYINKLL